MSELNLMTKMLKTLQKNQALDLLLKSTKNKATYQEHFFIILETQTMFLDKKLKKKRNNDLKESVIESERNNIKRTFHIRKSSTQSSKQVLIEMQHLISLIKMNNFRMIFKKLCTCLQDLVSQNLQTIINLMNNNLNRLLLVLSRLHITIKIKRKIIVLLMQMRLTEMNQKMLTSQKLLFLKFKKLQLLHLHKIRKEKKLKYFENQLQICIKSFKTEVAMQ